MGYPMHAYEGQSELQSRMESVQVEAIHQIVLEALSYGDDPQDIDFTVRQLDAKCLEILEGRSHDNANRKAAD